MSNDVSLRRILILTANPRCTDQLRLDKEARDIKEGLRLARERDRFIIDSEWAVRPKDIRRAILYLNPQIVHFSGHGAEDGGLAFENEMGQVQLVQPEALRGLFRLFSTHVECVLLNACYSEVQANAIAQHIDFVIGMNKAIGDSAAIEFAVGFYDALGAGRSVEAAFEFGCNAIQMAGIPEYLTPVLRRKHNSSLNSNASLLTSDSVTQSLKCKTSPSKVRYEFVLSGSISEVSRQKLEAIVAHLQEITGDTSLTLLKIESGSIKLILEGSEEGFNLLELLIRSGELDHALDIPVQDIRLLLASNEADHALAISIQDAGQWNSNASSFGKNFYFRKILSSLRGALLIESDPSVRCTIAEALGNIGGSEATEALRGALQNDKNSQVRVVIVKELARMGVNRSRGGTQMSGVHTINITGGNYYESINTEGDSYIQGNYFSMSQDLPQAATQIQEVLEQLQNKGVTVADAQEQVAKGMITQAQSDPKMRDKLVRWGQSLGDATVSDVVKGVVKLAIRSAGLPLP